jgi:hypothetical protein
MLVGFIEQRPLKPMSRHERRTIALTVETITRVKTKKGQTIIDVEVKSKATYAGHQQHLWEDHDFYRVLPLFEANVSRKNSLTVETDRYVYVLFSIWDGIRYHAME